MSPLPEKAQQITLAHAGLIHAVVIACQNRERRAELEPLLEAASANGWNTLVMAIRRILGRTRDSQVLAGLDEEDCVIAEAILRGLQDPATLPDPQARPDPGMAAPGLAGMIHAAASGDVAALQLLGRGSGRRCVIGIAVLAGLSLKVALERPLAAPTQWLPGWDFPVAPLAHLTGAAAGLLCGAVARVVAGRRRPAVR